MKILYITLLGFKTIIVGRTISKHHNLHDKDIIGIGSGKGFLLLLCELGNNRAVGFDPSYVPQKTIAR